ncbi:type VI secretion protein [Streptomyces sp. NPDC046985]|uniref:type VI secretion protein n=1 Tax=Streptomyces sp. NPDC046985 TaxID=3155377 RepID=UPI0033F0D365
MTAHDHDPARGRGGIPDGLLLGLLAFLLGMTVLAWTATGLSGLFAHGAWPPGVSFAHTPQAIRRLVVAPHDLPGAWPHTPAGRLSGYGLFWGLFLGQLMVLFTLAVFVMGTVARWRTVRARRRAGHAAARERAASARTGDDDRSGAPERRPDASPPPHRDDVPAPHEAPVQHPAPLPEQPVPASSAPTLEKPPPAPAVPVSVPAPSLFAASRTGVHLAPRESRRTAAAQAIRDAAGPALVVTSNPAVWQDTKDSRAKLGPVLLYDPVHLCDTPARLHWPPASGCEDKETATARAAALLAPVRPTARIDQAVHDTAQTLLRSYLHAAAIDGRTVRHVHRWSQGSQLQDAVRALRTHPAAAPGAAGELEAALTSHPDRRDVAQELTRRALASLVTVNVREACTPNRTDALTLDSFVDEGGTLYLVGESLEDPRTDPGAMPLLTALAASVVERGRRMAERSSSGRLDPPLTLVLDDVAAVAPFPALPELLSGGAGLGLPTLVLLRSHEQGRARWPHDWPHDGFSA